MLSYVGVYRGKSVGSAHLVAVSSDPVIVADVSERMLSQADDCSEAEPDPIVRRLKDGRREALKALLREIQV